MAKLEYIEIAENYSANFLEAFRQYASVPDDSRDALLLAMLKASVLKVQEFADKALAVTTLRVTAKVPEGSGVIRLYMGGGDVTHCTADTGEEVPFDSLPGGRLQLFVRRGTVQVTYTTRPNEGDRQALLPTVLRYATALYDGEEADALNRILTEAL